MTLKQFKDQVVTLDAGCAERSCACYSPQFGDVDGVPYYPESIVIRQQDRIKQLEETQKYLYKTHDADKAQIEALKRPNNVVGVPADKLAEMQAEIEALKNIIANLTRINC
jgi:hypothetical protein